MTANFLKLWATGLCLVAVTAGSAAAGTQYGAFTLTTDPENAYLPLAVTYDGWPDVQLLDREGGLNLGYTTFEFRNKYYNEENRNIWARQRDPRFVVDVEGDITGPDPVELDGWVGESVSYRSSWADVTRSILFDPQAPRMRIVYELAVNRVVVVHMPEMLGVRLVFGEAFNQRLLLDGRDPAGDLLVAEQKAVHIKRSLFPAGPVGITDAEGEKAMLVTHTVTGDVPSPLPSSMLELSPGTTIVITIDLTLLPDGAAAMGSAMRAAYQSMDEDDQVYVLFATGNHLLAIEEDAEAGEAVLLEVAARKPQWYNPFMQMAEHRLRHRIDGLVRGYTRGQLYHEAAYRMPWNYGIILRGGDYLNDERLSDAQQQQLLMNLLAAMENTHFYANYYVGPARTFENRGMIAQACAMYRQGLWALEHYPVREEIRERHRAGFEREIARLEQILLTQITARPPQPVEVRPE